MAIWTKCKRQVTISNSNTMQRRKVLIILSFLLAVGAAHGQEIVRTGDRYLVGETTYCTSTAFRGYLKNTSPEVFAQYNKGYKTAMVGWGLLAVGVAAVPLGVMGMMANQDNPPAFMTEEEWANYRKLHEMITALFASQVGIGGGMAAAGIVMLGVGYHKMHHVVDEYGVPQAEAPQAYWNISLTGNGIGLVCNF